jgi:hypothetical protein
MNKLFLALLATAALGWGGCASDTEYEDPDPRGPAPYSPDPMSHVPRYENNDPLQGPTS